MLSELIDFYCMLLAPAWMRDRTPDETHFYRRFFTAKYRAKRNKAKWLWIGMLALMLCFPYPPLMLAVLLFTTFLTFSLLDESN